MLVYPFTQALHLSLVHVLWVRSKVSAGAGPASGPRKKEVKRGREEDDAGGV